MLRLQEVLQRRHVNYEIIAENSVGKQEQVAAQKFIEKMFPSK